MRMLKVLAAAAALVASHAGAAFHLWAMGELYTNADGSVQFLELAALAGGQQFVGGHVLESRCGGTSKFFTFPANLPGDTAGRRMLIGTQGFASLGVVSPDYTVPDGFFCRGAGTIDFAHQSDIWNHPAPPADGSLSLNRDGSTGTNSPRNFAGQTGTVVLTPPAPGVSIGPTSLDFGTVAVGSSSAPQTITFLSTGTAPYRITGLSANAGACGTTPICSGSDFQCTTTCVVGQDYPANQSCQITATFRPTASGARSTQISVCDNVDGRSSTTPAHRINLGLQGTGSGGTSPALNVQGLWWRSPAGSESGWGVNITQQGGILFATWFTYDTDGNGMWLVMSEGRSVGPDSYVGTLYRTTGPAFNANPFNPSQVSVTPVGTATFSFTDANNGSFVYTVNGVSQTKSITRQVYSAPVPACTADSTGASSTNFQDLWWRSPAGSESGWGVNLTHQGDIIFATWFTYAADGRGMWLVMSDGRRTTGNTFSGPLYRTRGPAFNASPWNPSQVTVTQVGTGTFSFSDANNGTFAYTVDGVSQTKSITRQVYGNPPTVCR